MTTLISSVSTKVDAPISQNSRKELTAKGATNQIYDGAAKLFQLGTNEVGEAIGNVANSVSEWVDDKLPDVPDEYIEEGKEFLNDAVDVGKEGVDFTVKSYKTLAKGAEELASTEFGEKIVSAGESVLKPAIDGYSLAWDKLKTGVGVVWDVATLESFKNDGVIKEAREGVDNLFKQPTSGYTAIEKLAKKGQLYAGGEKIESPQKLVDKYFRDYSHDFLSKSPEKLNWDSFFDFKWDFKNKKVNLTPKEVVIDSEKALVPFFADDRKTTFDQNNKYDGDLLVTDRGYVVQLDNRLEAKGSETNFVDRLASGLFQTGVADGVVKFGSFLHKVGEASSDDKNKNVSDRNGDVDDIVALDTAHELLSLTQELNAKGDTFSSENMGMEIGAIVGDPMMWLSMYGFMALKGGRIIKEGGKLEKLIDNKFGKGMTEKYSDNIGNFVDKHTDAAIAMSNPANLPGIKNTKIAQKLFQEVDSSIYVPMMFYTTEQQIATGEEVNLLKNHLISVAITGPFTQIVNGTENGLTRVQQKWGSLVDDDGLKLVAKEMREVKAGGRTEYSSEAGTHIDKMKKAAEKDFNKAFAKMEKDPEITKVLNSKLEPEEMAEEIGKLVSQDKQIMKQLLHSNAVDVAKGFVYATLHKIDDPLGVSISRLFSGSENNEKVTTKNATNNNAISTDLNQDANKTSTTTKTPIINAKPQLDLNSEDKVVTEYMISRGETLGSIAKSLGVTEEQLLLVNPQIKDKNVIFEDQIINLPR